jgi:uncharacterized protein YcbK (DUF882 family)
MLVSAALTLSVPAGSAHAGARSTVTLVSIKDDPGVEAPSRALETRPAEKRSAEKKPPTPTPGAPSKASAKKGKKPPARAAELLALNSHETFELRPGPQGGFGKQTMRSLARFLRCHHTQRVHAMSERLARLLYTVASHFDFARLEIVAGYRAPRVAKEKGNPKSPHKRGVACDFKVAGVSNEVVRDYVRTLPRVGVGYYPNSGFVHLDVRDKQSAFWVDYSAPGERAKYSKTPEDDVRKLPTLPDNPGEGEDPQGGEGQGAAPPYAPALEPSTPRNNE